MKFLLIGTRFLLSGFYQGEIIINWTSFTSVSIIPTCPLLPQMNLGGRCLVVSSVKVRIGCFFSSVDAYMLVVRDIVWFIYVFVICMDGTLNYETALTLF
jgi:hypothetical protein